MHDLLGRMTGLPMVIYVTLRQGEHAPRLKVSKHYGYKYFEGQSLSVIILRIILFLYQKRSCESKILLALAHNLQRYAQEHDSPENMFGLQERTLCSHLRTSLR